MGLLFQPPAPPPEQPQKPAEQRLLPADHPLAASFSAAANELKPPPVIVPATDGPSLQKMIVAANKITNLRYNKKGKVIGHGKNASELAGHCAHNVVTAMQEAGFKIPMKDAHELSEPLKANGFVEVPIDDNYKAVPGDVMLIVVEKQQRHKEKLVHQHIGFYVGGLADGIKKGVDASKQWLADAYHTDTPYAGVAFSAAHYMIFRNPTLAQQALQLTAQSVQMAAEAYGLPTGGSTEHRSHAVRHRFASVSRHAPRLG